MISIILPTYNEAENIKIIVPDILEMLDRENIMGEIIIVDDDSPDGTAALAKEYLDEYPVKVYVRKRDRGLSRAVIQGFELSRGEICLVMDADLSHPVEKIPEMIRPILENRCDLVVGSRKMSGGGSEGWSLSRKIISNVAGYLAKGLTGLSDPTSGFMAVRKSVIDGTDLDPLGWKIVLEVAVKAGPRVQELPIIFSDRKRGKSKLGIKAQIDYIHHLWRLYCYRYPDISQFVKFCLTGISGIIIDTAILMGLVEFVSFDPRLAAIFAFTAAVSWNYIFNRIWTFNHGTDTKIAFTYITFVMICIMGLGIRIGVMHVLIKYVGMGESQWYVLASLIGIAAATIFNFLGSRYLVFSKLFQK